MVYKRSEFGTLLGRVREARRFVQVLAGPRQTGKTTLVQQVLEEMGEAGHYASADEPTLKDRVWIEQQWEAGRRLAAGGTRHSLAVLVLDEIQKIPGWSDTVKRLWDEDTHAGLPLRVVVLGSAPLLVQRGLSESLAGRFEVIPITHWSAAEMEHAFGWTLDQYIYYGGYPGAAPLIGDPQRWARYILDSLVETTISRDILLMRRVDKPVLLRRLFELGCSYSGQALSFTKMLGQLQDAGNATTLAHYLDLLKAGGLVEGLPKYAGQRVRQRASSPKFQVHNNALLSAQSHWTFEQTRDHPDVWGRLTESAVGTWLLNESQRTNIKVFYWVDRNKEVDFVLAQGDRVVAIQVKSGQRKTTRTGMDAFTEAFDVHKKLLVGGQGIGLREFLCTPIESWF